MWAPAGMCTLSDVILSSRCGTTALRLQWMSPLASRARKHGCPRRLEPKTRQVTSPQVESVLAGTKRGYGGPDKDARQTRHESHPEKGFLNGRLKITDMHWVKKQQLLQFFIVCHSVNSSWSKTESWTRREKWRTESSGPTLRTTVILSIHSPTSRAVLSLANCRIYAATNRKLFDIQAFRWLNCSLGVFFSDLMYCVCKSTSGYSSVYS